MAATWTTGTTNAGGFDAAFGTLSWTTGTVDLGIGDIYLFFFSELVSTLPAITIDGVTATQVGSTLVLGNAAGLSCWKATATHATGVISFIDAVNSYGTVAANWGLVAGNGAPTLTSVETNGATTQGPVTGTIASNGVGVASYASTFANGIGTPTWTGATRIVAMEGGIGTSNQSGVLGASTSTAGAASITIAATPLNFSDNGMMLLAFPPSGGATAPFTSPQNDVIPHAIRISRADASVGLNPNLFKNPIPIFNGDGSTSKVNPDWLPSPVPPLNINLFKNAIPFLNLDTARFTRLPPPAPPTFYNSALYTVTVTTMPFNQMDWSRSVRAPMPAVDFYNLVLLAPSDSPFNQTDWAKPFFPRAARLPDQPYNQALYTVTVTVLPFNQTDWTPTLRLKSQPAPAPVWNPNLFTNPIPFAQYHYPLVKRVPAAPVDLSVALNLNLFKNPIPIFNYSYPQQQKPLPYTPAATIGFQILNAPLPPPSLDVFDFQFIANVGKLMGH